MKRVKKVYSVENLVNALQDVKDGNCNVTTAARIHNVPRQTLADKIKGKSPAVFCKPGPHPLLGTEVENDLKNWAVQNTESGFITSKDSILFSVRQIIQNHSELGLYPFLKNRTLGIGWYKAFKKRYPEIVFKKLENFKYPQVSKNELRQWFRKVRKSLGKDAEILIDSERIFCMGQLLLTLNNASKKDPSHSFEKEGTTILLAANVEAKFAPVMINFKHASSSETDSQDSMTKSPYTCTVTGKMSCQIFYDYIVNVFYPDLVNSGIEFPIVLFLDQRVAHTSFPLSEFCQQKGINLIPFLPNSSNLHPFEKGFFELFLETWKTEVKFWPARNNNRNMKEENVESVISSIIRFTEFTNTIRQAFRNCGIFPFDVNAVHCDTIDGMQPQPAFLREYQSPSVGRKVPAARSKSNECVKWKIENVKSMKEESFNSNYSLKSEDIVEEYVIEDFVEETVDAEDDRCNIRVEFPSFQSNCDATEVDNSYSFNLSNKRHGEILNHSHIKRKKMEDSVWMLESNAQKLSITLKDMSEKGELDLNINVESIVATQDDTPEVLKKKNKDLQGLLEKVIDLLKEKSNVCLNLEKQNSALNLQITSLKEIVSITKNLLSIRNVEVENMQKDMTSLQEKINAEKERHNKMIETVSSANKLNEDIKGEYQNQMSLFQQLRDKYNEKVSLLTQENLNLKAEIQNLKGQSEDHTNENE